MKKTLKVSAPDRLTFKLRFKQDHNDERCPSGIGVYKLKKKLSTRTDLWLINPKAPTICQSCHFFRQGKLRFPRGLFQNWKVLLLDNQIKDGAITQVSDNFDRIGQECFHHWQYNWFMARWGASFFAKRQILVNLLQRRADIFSRMSIVAMVNEKMNCTAQGFDWFSFTDTDWIWK